jgi:hypothetical protein
MVQNKWRAAIIHEIASEVRGENEGPDMKTPVFEGSELICRKV